MSKPTEGMKQIEWAKHLRKYSKRVVNKASRRFVKKILKSLKSA